MKKLWMELSKEEQIRVIAIIINVVVGSLVSWVVSMICIPEFNGLFIPIREWGNVMKTSGYWEAYGMNSIVMLIMLVMNWFTMTEKWRENYKNIVKEYISDLASYLKR